jgi:hypothetical protein
MTHQQEQPTLRDENTATSALIDISKLDFRDGHWYIRGHGAAGEIHASKIHGSPVGLLSDLERKARRDGREIGIYDCIKALKEHEQIGAYNGCPYCGRQPNAPMGVHDCPLVPVIKSLSEPPHQENSDNQEEEQ